MVIWMGLDQIGTTNVGTKQEEIELLNVCQKRKTMNVEIYHFENKRHCTKQLDNHNNYKIEVEKFD
jgi:hypothetical protein